MDSATTDLRYRELMALAARIGRGEISPVAVADVAMAQAEAAEAGIVAGRYPSVPPLCEGAHRCVPLSTREAGGEGRVRGVVPQSPLYRSCGTALAPTLSRCAGEGDAIIGLFELAATFDHVGPMARSAVDAGAAFQGVTSWHRRHPLA